MRGLVAGVARSLAELLLALSVLGAVAVGVQLARSTGVSDGEAVLVALGGLAVGVLPLLAVHMLADCRDALWYLAHAEEQRALDDDDRDEISAPQHRRRVHGV
jgi:hypothetical protein